MLRRTCYDPNKASDTLNVIHLVGKFVVSLEFGEVRGNEYSIEEELGSVELFALAANSDSNIFDAVGFSVVGY